MTGIGQTVGRGITRGVAGTTAEEAARRLLRDGASTTTELVSRDLMESGVVRFSSDIVQGVTDPARALRQSPGDGTLGFVNAEHRDLVGYVDRAQAARRAATPGSADAVELTSAIADAQRRLSVYTSQQRVALAQSVVDGLDGTATRQAGEAIQTLANAHRTHAEALIGIGRVDDALPHLDAASSLMDTRVATLAAARDLAGSSGTRHAVAAQDIRAAQQAAAEVHEQNAQILTNAGRSDAALNYLRRAGDNYRAATFADLGEGSGRAWISDFNNALRLSARAGDTQGVLSLVRRAGVGESTMAVRLMHQARSIASHEGDNMLTAARALIDDMRSRPYRFIDSDGRVTRTIPSRPALTDAEWRSVQERVRSGSPEDAVGFIRELGAPRT